MHNRDGRLTLKVGDWWYIAELDKLARLDDNGNIVTTADFDFLCQKTINYFIRHPGRLVSREELLQHVWGRIDVTDSCITRVIRVIRLTLGDSRASPLYLQTISKVGYRLIASVSEDRLPSPVKPAVSQPFQAKTPAVSLPQKTLRLQDGWLIPLILLCSMILLVLLLNFYGSDWQQQKTDAFFARYMQLTELAGSEIDPALSPDGLWLAYIHFDKHHHYASLMLKHLASGEQRLLLRQSAALASPAWSPDGRALVYLAATETAAELQQINFDAALQPQVKKRLFTLAADSVLGHLSWSADGQWLVYPELARDQKGSSLWLYNFKYGSREQITLLPPTALRDSSAVFSADGRQLAFIRHQQHHSAEIWLLDMATRSSQYLQTLEGEAPLQMSWLPQAQQLLINRSDRRLMVIDATTGQIHLQLCTDQKTQAVRVSPLGHVMAVIGELWHRRVESRPNPLFAPAKPAVAAPAEPLFNSSRSVLAVQVNPQSDGPLAVFSERSGRRQIWFYYPDGRQLPVSDFVLDHQVQALRFSPDGQQLLAALDEQIWLFSASAPPQRVSRLHQNGWQPSWSQDGEAIYFMTVERGQHQVVKASARSLRQTRLEAYNYYQYSPDGTYLLYRLQSTEVFRLKFLTTAQEQQLAVRVKAGTLPDFVLAREHLYFTEKKDQHHFFIKALHLQSNQIKATDVSIQATEKRFSLSADERHFYITTATLGELDIAQLLLSDIQHGQLFSSGGTHFGI
jgi:Tol biopolymer transport system component/DNA-binding winged helix-turn-helix (wHTH) protein